MQRTTKAGPLSLSTLSSPLLMLGMPSVAGLAEDRASGELAFQPEKVLPFRGAGAVAKPE